MLTEMLPKWNKIVDTYTVPELDNLTPEEKRNLALQYGYFDTVEALELLDVSTLWEMVRHGNYLPLKCIAEYMATTPVLCREPTDHKIWLYEPLYREAGLMKHYSHVFCLKSPEVVIEELCNSAPADAKAIIVYLKPWLTERHLTILSWKHPEAMRKYAPELMDKTCVEWMAIGGMGVIDTPSIPWGCLLKEK